MHTVTMMTTITLSEEVILRAAPIWNVGNNVAQFLAWADQISFSTENPSTPHVVDALKGLAYVLADTKTVRPSVVRFLTNAKPEQVMPWIVRAAGLGLDPAQTVDLLNKEYRS